jgi:hypothetical protein
MRAKTIGQSNSPQGLPTKATEPPQSQDRDVAAVDCHRGSSPVVVYDKSSDQLQYCDGGIWKVIAKEEFRAANDNHATTGVPDDRAPEGHQMFHALPTSPLATKHSRNANGVLTAKAEGFGKAGHGHGDDEEKTGDDQEHASGMDVNRIGDKSYFCRAIPSGNRRAFHCQKTQQQP